MTLARSHRRLLFLPLLALSLLVLACGSIHAKPKTVDPFSRLVLARSQRLTVRMPSGSEKTLVAAPPGGFPTSPAWSPDGNFIAYVQSVPFTGDTSADWGGDIYIMSAGGGTPQLIHKHTQPGDEVYGLAWTIDGKALLLGHHVTTLQNGSYQSATQQLERLDLTNGTSTVLVRNAVYPSVSRDGSKLAYLAQDPDTGQGGIWVASIDGQNARQIVSLGERFPAILSPRISPAGDTVAFSAPGQQTSPAGKQPAPGVLQKLLAALLPKAAAAHGLPMDIWRASVADGSLEQLTHLNADDPYVAWSRDGSAIAFIATGGLYTVGADGSGLSRIGQGEFNGNIDTPWAGSG